MDENKDLISLFSDMPDPRVNRRKLHKLQDIISISILAVICGAETWIDIEDFGISRSGWLSTFLELPNGIPSHDTFNRVFSLLDPCEFELRFSKWTQEIYGKLTGHIAIDGKVINGSGNRRKKKEPICIVSAWSSELDLILAQTPVEDKSNEITAIPRVLEMLEVEGCLITIDAIGCQKKIVEQVIEEKADYVLAVKGNQENLHSEIINFFDQALDVNFEYVPHDYHKSYEEQRGRKEERTLYVTDKIDWLPMKNEWKGLKSIICVISKREVDGKKSTEKRYYISSLEANAQKHAISIRNHWGIENQQHWLLDVGFQEDKSKIRNRIAVKNFEILRRLALNLFKQEGSKMGIKRKRRKAGWDEKYLLEVISKI